MTIGLAAEFIFENQSPQLKPPTDQFPPFAPSIEAQYIAVTATGKITTDDTDPAVVLLKDWPHKPPPVSVTIKPVIGTVFEISAAQNPGMTATELLAEAEGRQALMGRLIADGQVEQAAALTGQTIADYQNYAAQSGADVRRAAQDLSALSLQLAAAGRSAEAVMTQQAMVDVLAGFTPAAADRLDFLLLLAEGRQTLMGRLVADGRVEQAAALAGQTIADYRNYAAQSGADVRRAAQDLSALSLQLANAGRSAEAVMTQQAMVDVLAGFTPAAADRLNFLLLLAEGLSSPDGAVDRERASGPSGSADRSDDRGLSELCRAIRCGCAARGRRPLGVICSPGSCRSISRSGDGPTGGHIDIM
jgi:hypothetical protein